MEIKRKIYLDRLIARKNNGFIKIITGIRRCGKSYLLNTLFYNHLLDCGVSPGHIVRFAFDSADDLIRIGHTNSEVIAITMGRGKADPQKFMAYISSLISDQETYYLLLDEVQNLDAFEFVLNSFLRKPNIDVYVTGSNSKFLSKDVITEFAGRGDEVHIMPLSFSEFCSVYDGSSDEAFDDYMTYGGLPALCMMRTEEQRITYLTGQMQNVYLRDIITRYNLRSDAVIKELLDILASGISCLTNPKKLADTFRSVKKENVAQGTIDRYISHLEDAFIISKALRYDVKGKKYIDTPYKIYFEDTGLRNARLAFRQYEPAHLMENIIYNELRVRGYKVDVGVVTAVTGGTRVSYEIDFVANMGSKRYYIQSAYAIPDINKLRQETQSFDKTDDSFKKIILIEKNIKPKRDEKGYVTMGVKEFLLNIDSMDL